MMKRYIESQKYHECQMVTALNAAIHLGILSGPPSRVEYELLVDLVKARNGSALEIIRLDQRLGLVRRRLSVVKPKNRKDKEGNRLIICAFLNCRMPLDLMVWSRGSGFHSIAVVAWRQRGRRTQFRVCNPGWGRRRWLDWSELARHMVYYPNVGWHTVVVKR